MKINKIFKEAMEKGFYVKRHSMLSIYDYVDPREVLYNHHGEELVVPLVICYKDNYGEECETDYFCLDNKYPLEEYKKTWALTKEELL